MPPPGSPPLPVAAGIGVGFLGLFGAPLSGLVWFAGRRSELRPAYVLLLSLFAAGLLPYFLIVEPGVSELFFTQYGYAAAVLVSAAGIYWLWWAFPSGTSRGRSVVAGFVIAWPVTLLLLIGVPLLLTSSDKLLYLVWYGTLGLIVVPLLAGVVRSGPGRRGLWVRLLLITILGASAFNVPLDVVPHLVRASRNGSLYVHGGTGLTAAMYRGLEWIRQNTRSTDVVAVSNYSVDANHPEYDDIYYSAFAERRVFLEGWRYGMKTLRLGPHYHISRMNMPYPERLRLNDAVFQRGDRAALRVLIRDYGVRYLLVDRVHYGKTAKVSALGRRVFSNSDVAIYAVRG